METSPLVKHYFNPSGGNEVLASYVQSGLEALKNGEVCVQVEKEDEQVLLSSNHVSNTPDCLTKPFILTDGKFYFQRYLSYENQVLFKIQSLIESGKDEAGNRLTELRKHKELIHELFDGFKVLEGLSEIENIDWQRVAVVNAFLKNFMVLTGGPGTGKTTTVSKLLVLLFSQNPNLRVSLIAQTGKASTRLKESLDNSRQYLNLNAEVSSCFDKIKPSTIHRFLGYIKGSVDFRRNQENPVESDVVILDESSMVDLPMMAKLLNAIPDGTRVYLLGDLNQLSSVEVGSVFGDLCLSLGDQVNRFSDSQFEIIKEFYPEFIRHSELGTIKETKPNPSVKEQKTQLSMFDSVPTVSSNESMKQDSDKSENPHSSLSQVDNILTDHVIKLERSYRFSSIKGLGKFAYGLLSRTEIDDDFLKEYKKSIKGDEGVRIVSTSGTEIEKEFISQYSEYIEEPDILKALDLMNKVKVLCAVKEGTRGVFELNRNVESLLESRDLIKPSTVNYHNQPVLILKNDYNVGLYNGDVGLVRKNESGRLMVYFKNENELVSYDISSLPTHQTAFAMTIHKSQGSEFEDVVLVLPEKEHKVLSKQLVYTGVTRAKKRVLIISPDQVLISAVEKVEQRLSNLKERF